MTKSTSAEPLVTVDTVEGVAVVTLRAPPANCYSYAMMRALDAAILELRMDDGVFAIVITGAGERFFCAGADITMLDGADARFKYNFCLHANETLLRLEHTAKPVIAAMNGHTVGGGFEVALACDLRIARRGAGKIGLPEIKLGVLPGTGGTARLVRLVGKARALELMLEARTLDADEALAHGLVHKVYDAPSGAAFLSAVVDYARSLCPPQTSGLAAGLIKRSVVSGGEMTLESHLALERELQQRLFTSEDAREGIRAYVEKRAPVFPGA